ncbi:hypothetical protein E3P99_02066 [Wallemia hederae]|uniref:UEV domain-containing protein n=1 Tax=Wallemia hederae TaxID=1540922 RepID=A0A4T0FME6_9BASI|nr:hypothetical protein E3P99_02066 [Wallemia hederae]
MSEVVRRWLEHVSGAYEQQRRVVSDVMSLLQTFSTLSPRTEVYTHDHGRSELLIEIHGTLPITYRSTPYFIPISIWIPQRYPGSPPWVYVTPTQEMLVRAGHGVDSSGRVQSPYLADWVKKPEAFNLIDLAQSLRSTFEAFPPLYAKPTPQAQSPPQQSATRSTTPARPQKPPSMSLSLSPNTVDQSSRVAQDLAHTWQTSPTTSHTLDRHSSTPQSQSQTRPHRPPPMVEPQTQSFEAVNTANTHASTANSPPTHPTPPTHPQITDLLTTEPDNLNIPLQPHHTPAHASRHAPTRPLNPNTVKLHATIHAIFSNKATMSLEHHKNIHDSQIALKTDLERARDVIADESARLESVKDICSSVALKVGDSIKEGEVALQQSHRRGEIGVDEIVCADNLVSNQLLDLVAEDRAIDDTMYHLGRALNAGRVDLDKTLRVVRELSREQFFKRALCKKIQMGLDGGANDAGGFYAMVNTAADQTESFHQ